MGGHWGVVYLAVGRQDVTLQHEALTMRFCWAFVLVGSCSEADYLERNSAMDDSIGGS